MDRKRVKFTIEVSGSPRTIAVVDQVIDGTSPGDLRVFVKHGRDSLEPPTASGLIQRRGIKSQKFSVHQSNDSPKRINLIKKTEFQRPEGGGKPKPVTRVHYTTALKHHNIFAIVTTRASADLTDERYNTSAEDAQTISLGSYSPDETTLYFSILVSRPGRKFVRNKECEFFQERQLAFERFHVTFIWCFVPGKSPPFSVPAEIETQAPEFPEGHANFREADMDTGVSERRFPKLFTHIAERARDIQMHLLVEAGLLTPNEAKGCMLFPYIPTSDIGSPLARKLFRKRFATLKRKGLISPIYANYLLNPE
ncbi:hypothetical protein [Teichococcus deserti]|uniref:hypothetical protein n=1 Tax=Teichococcus deserti TaxID=1817963 RepID=UPI0010562803|nr:hypothetical protein [Pseudoroseomonas deserti]